MSTRAQAVFAVVVSGAVGSGTATAAPVAAERVVAVVNDAIILESELEARMLPLLVALPEVADATERERRFAGIRRRTLDDMIDEELVVEAGEQARIEVGSGDLQAAFHEIERDNQLSYAGLLQLLARQGFTVQEYAADLRRQILRRRAIDTIVAPKLKGNPHPAELESQTRVWIDDLRKKAYIDIKDTPQ